MVSVGWCVCVKLQKSHAFCIAVHACLQGTKHTVHPQMYQSKKLGRWASHTEIQARIPGQAPHSEVTLFVQNVRPNGFITASTHYHDVSGLPFLLFRQILKHLTEKGIITTSFIDFALRVSDEDGFRAALWLVDRGRHWLKPQGTSNLSVSIQDPSHCSAKFKLSLN